MKKRVVLKIGSAVVAEDGDLAFDRLEKLSDLIAKLREKFDVLFVSSGAVASGYSMMKIDKTKLPNKQALAAVGQPRLMAHYADIFSKHDIKTAQILISAQDLEIPEAALDAQHTVDVLLKNGVLPIINENDTITTYGLEFGDNDQLSAHVTKHFNADMLVILSDIDGYYSKNPKTHADAELLKIVNALSEDELSATPNPNDHFATGGIVTKLLAADFMLKQKKEMFLASGFNLEAAESFLIYDTHNKGTLFKSKD